MTTFTSTAAELVRIVRAVERSAARDDARLTLASIQTASDAPGLPDAAGRCVPTIYYCGTQPTRRLG